VCSEKKECRNNSWFVVMCIKIKMIYLRDQEVDLCREAMLDVFEYRPDLTQAQNCLPIAIWSCCILNLRSAYHTQITASHRYEVPC
jgi:hypothetical protein